jgi:hypothetical protein
MCVLVYEARRSNKLVHMPTHITHIEIRYGHTVTDSSYNTHAKLFESLHQYSRYLLSKLFIHCGVAASSVICSLTSRIACGNRVISAFSNGLDGSLYQRPTPGSRSFIIHKFVSKLLYVCVDSMKVTSTMHVCMCVCIIRHNYSVLQRCIYVQSDKMLNGLRTLMRHTNVEHDSTDCD